MSLETAKATEQSECGGRRAVSATGCLHGPRRTREPPLSPSEILCHRGRVALFPLIERFPWGRKNYRMLLCAASPYWHVESHASNESASIAAWECVCPPTLASSVLCRLGAPFRRRGGGQESTPIVFFFMRHHISYLGM